MQMASLWRASRRTLKRPIHAGFVCRFGSKPPVVDPPPTGGPCPSPFFQVRSVATSPAVTTSSSDFKASPMVAAPLILSGDNKSAGIDDELVLYPLSERKESIRVQKNRKSYLAPELRNAKLMGSSNGWLMYMNRQDCSLYLRNPFSPQTSPIIPLPPIETLPDVRARLFRRRRSETDESDTSSTEFDHEFVLQDWCTLPENDLDLKWFQVPIEYDPGIATAPAEAVVTRVGRREKVPFVSRMVMSSPPPSPSNGYANYRDCIVAMVYGPWRLLAFCRLGDNRWTPLDASCQIQDMTFEDMCLYTWEWECTRRCNLRNPKSPEWDVIENGGPEYRPGYNMEYLVKSSTESGRLLLVQACYERKEMVLHQLDLLDDVQGSWVPVEALHDQALFVGDFSETLSVPAAQLPSELKPNCVYFNDRSFGLVGAFSLEDGVMDFGAFGDLGLDLPSKEEIERAKDYREWMAWVTPNPW